MQLELREKKESLNSCVTLTLAEALSRNQKNTLPLFTHLSMTRSLLSYQDGRSLIQFLGVCEGLAQLEITDMIVSRGQPKKATPVQSLRCDLEYIADLLTFVVCASAAQEVKIFASFAHPKSKIKAFPRTIGLIKLRLSLVTTPHFDCQFSAEKKFITDAEASELEDAFFLPLVWTKLAKRFSPLTLLIGADDIEPKTLWKSFLFEKVQGSK
jgi:hypothetical protein